MSDPWFNPNLYAWIPGTAFGVLGGLWGGLAGTLAPRGRGRRLVLGSCWALVIASALLLALAVAAIACGQPWGVWYGLGLPGVLGLLVIPPNLFVIRRRYRQAEERGMAVRDLG